MTDERDYPEGSPEYWRADPFDALNVLEAAGYLEAMRQAVELTEQDVADEPDDPEFVAELEELRAEARAIFERKFFEVN